MRSKIAIKNISITLILQIITIICGFVIPKLIIENYGSAVNGLVSSIVEFLGYIALLEAGFGPVVKSILYRPIAEGNTDEIKGILKSAESFFKKIAYIFLIYIIILCIIYPNIVSKEFDNVYTLSLILIIAISTFSEYYFGMTYRLFLQANQKTYIVSCIQIITLILNTILTVVFVKSGFSIHVVKFISAVIYVLKSLLFNAYAKRKFNLKISSNIKKVNIDKKWDGLAQHIAAVIHSNTDIAILILFTNVIEVSVYTVYKLVITGVKNFIAAFISGVDSLFGDMLAKNEKKNLNNKFKVYEVLYFSLITVVFSCTIILIVPFISVYTLGISDANYSRYLFGTLIVCAEFFWAIRQPYNELVKAAGHFRETRIGAWIEVILNIVISIFLVFNYGMVGVAIGTLVAMVIRTIEFMYHTSKYILERSIWVSFNRLIIIVIQVVLVSIISMFIPKMYDISYISWFIYAVEIFILSSVIVLPLNIIIYKNDMKSVFNMLKKLIQKNEEKLAIGEENNVIIKHKSKK